MTNGKVRVLVADDEPLARERLRTLLAPVDWLELVAECPTGTEAIDAIGRLEPDLVFLDVQMPGASGFEVIEAIGPARMPLVVFVTAFDHYALRAFDVHALDYLLKPFDRQRFQEALVRARQHLERPSNGDLERRLLELVQDLKPTAQRLERFVIKSGQVIVEQGEIREPLIGKLLHVSPEYDVDVETDIAAWFEKYYSIRFRNYPVSDAYLHNAEEIACG